MTGGIPEGAREPASDHAETTPASPSFPDLVLVGDALAPRFPVSLEATRVVLYDGDSGELRVHWHLESNDLARAVAGFSASGGRPLLLLRLRRRHDDGATELVGENQLRLIISGGDDESSFRVDADPGAYEAELGLGNEAGGWLLLARSNRLARASGIALASLTRVAAENDQATLDPTLGGDVPVGLAPQFPLDPEAAGVSPLARPLETRTLAGAVAASPGCLGEDPRDEVLAAVVGDAGHLATDRVMGTPVPPSGVTGMGGELLLQPTVPRDAPRIPPLRYATPACVGTTLVIEAELRINGWAAPGSDIDLFGHPYRVGPGGRFQFVIKVDDPSLLRQALALHPPPELTCSRED